MSARTKHFDHFTIRDVMEDLPPLETIDARSPIRDALAKMCTKNYSQLPVIKDQTCLGSVTFESILRQLRKEDQKGNLALNFMDWPVERFLEKNTRFVSPDDDILKHIEWMAEKGFVLIGSRLELESLVTNYDLALFFKNKTEPFLLLREIETSLRYIVSQKLQDKKLGKLLASVKRERGSPPSCLDDLTLDELRQLILRNWGEFEDLFLDRQRIDNQIQRIRDLRNRIFHFRAHITLSELITIRNIRNNFLRMAKSLSER